MEIASSTVWLWRILIWGVLLGVFLLSGCSNDVNRAPATESTIRIGALYPLTGADVSTGKDLKAGLELAVEIINNRYDLPLPLAERAGLPGQSGRKIELVLRDTQSDPAIASKRLDELVSSEKVVAVIGCYHSSVTALASVQAEKAHIPFLNADSTSPLLTQRGLRWFFRTTPDDQMFSLNFFEFLNQMRERRLLSPASPLVLVYENGLWGTNVALAQQRLAWQYDYRIISDVPYGAAAEHFEAELEKIESAMPAVVLQASYERDAIAFMKGYRSRGVQPLAILAMDSGFVSPGFIPALGAEAEHVLSREVWALDLSEKKPLIKKVNDLFRQRYQHDMTGNSARSFTGLMVLAEAFNRAQGLSPEAVHKALLQTEWSADQLIMPWDGIRFDQESGQNTLGRGIIVQVQQGRYVTVWPESLAVRPPVWPVPESVQEK